MSLLTRLATIAGIFLFFCTSAVAQTGEWRVVETSGTVRIAQTMAGVQLVSTGESLRAGSVLSTGLDGRAVLVRGEQSIVVGPNSRMSLPAVEDEGMTRILQDLGTLMFKVDKRGKQHFRVETPVIAAVVKGTTFTVTAGAESHAVHVAEGLVEVTALEGMNTVLVGAGETVQVSTANHAFLTPGDNGNQQNGQSEETPGFKPAENGKDASLLIPDGIGFEPLDFAGLTNGLVRAGQAGAPAVETTNRFTGGDLYAAAGNMQTASYSGGLAAGADNGLGVYASAPGVGIGAGNGVVGVDVAVGNGGVGAGVDVGVGNGGVDAGVDVGVGNGGVDTGVDVAVGNGGVDAGVDVGVGNGGVDAGVDVGVGNGGVDAGVDVGVGNGGVGAGVDVGAGNGGVDVGVEVGGLDVGLDIGEDGVDLDLDLGLGNPDEGSGLLGGLFNR
jgi:hypothetical protein